MDLGGHERSKNTKDTKVYKFDQLFDSQKMFDHEFLSQKNSVSRVIGLCRTNMTQNKVEFIIFPDNYKSHSYEVLTYDDVCNVVKTNVVGDNEVIQLYNILSYDSIIKAYKKGKRYISYEYRRKDPEGNIRWAAAVCFINYDPISKEIYCFNYIKDIDYKKKRELSFPEKISHDSETGLYNAATAKKMIKSLIETNKNNTSCCVLYIQEITNYNELKELLGRPVLMKVFSELCRRYEFLLPSDIITYYEGNGRFLSFAPDIESEDIAEELMLNLISEFEEILGTLKIEITFKCNLGVVLHTGPNLVYQNLYNKAIASLSAPKNGIAERYAIVRDNEFSKPPETNNNNEALNVLFESTNYLLSYDKLDRALNKVLSIVNKFYDAECSYIFELDKDKKKVTITYEYKADKMSRLHFNKNFSNEVFPVLLNAYETKQTLILDNVKEMIPSQNFYSIFLIPFPTENNIVGFIGINNATTHFDDISLLNVLSVYVSAEIQKQKLQSKQEYLIYHDDLTGLLDRNSYLKYLSQTNENSIISMGILCADINGLKHLNDLFGLGYGDNIIKSIGLIFTKHFRSTDVFRLNGGEFLVLCKDITHDVFIERVLAVREEAERKHPHYLSLGYTWTDKDINIINLTEHARQLLSIAKNEYRQSTKKQKNYYYSDALDNIKKQIDSGKYIMYLQPKSDISTGVICGAEALVRMKNSDDSIITPNNFIPTLEKENLIRFIDFFMFEEACKTLHKWNESNLISIPISINFSRATLLEPGFINTLFSIFQKYTIPANFLELEITESLGEMERETISEISTAITEKGFLLSLDDFGSNYSSLSILATVNFNTVKLDKSIIDDIVTNKTSQSIVKNVLQICKDTSLISLAEGVETKEQLDLLAKYGCNTAQGYYFDKPMSRSKFEEKYL